MVLRNGLTELPSLSIDVQGSSVAQPLHQREFHKRKYSLNDIRFIYPAISFKVLKLGNKQ